MDSGVIWGEKEEWADENMTVKVELGRACKWLRCQEGDEWWTPGFWTEKLR